MTRSKVTKGMIWVYLERFVDSEYAISVSVAPNGEMEEFDLIAKEAGKIYDRGPGIDVIWSQLPENPICGIFLIRIFGKIQLRTLVTPEDLK